MSKSNVVELDAPAPAKALTVVERASVALNSQKHRIDLAEMIENTKSIIVVKNAAGRDQAHGAYMRLKNTRVAIETVGKDARDEANKFSKAVIAEEKSLVEIISPEEARLKKLRDDWDEAREAEKRELERFEEERQKAVQNRIDMIKAVVANVAGKTSAEIDAASVALDFMTITIEDFGKRAEEAEQIKADTMIRLGEMYEVAQVREAAAAAEIKRLEEERIERDRVAEQQRIEGERLAALQRELDERAAAQRREQEERERAAADARAEQDRIAQERRDAEDRASQEKRDAAQKILYEQEAEMRRKREAIEAEERAAQVRAEAEAAEARRVEQERLNAEAAEKRRLDQEADDARRAAEEAKHAAMQEIRARAPAMYNALLKVVEQYGIFSKRGPLTEFQGEGVISASILFELYEHAMDAIQDLPVIAE